MKKERRRQIIFLEEEGVSKEKKVLRKSKMRQDKISVSTSFSGKGNSSSAVKNLFAASLVISTGICWSLYKGNTTVTRILSQAQHLPSSVQL